MSTQYPMVVPYQQAMDSPQVTQAVALHFGAEHVDNPDCRFLCMVMLCCAVWPDQPLPGGGQASSGVAVFYVCADAPPGTCVPWVCEMDTGASAVYRFEKVGDGTQGFNEGDSVPFQQRTLDLLASSQWVLARGTLTYAGQGPQTAAGAPDRPAQAVPPGWAGKAPW